VNIHQAIQRRVQEAIEVILEEELEAALGAARYERRSQRGGYRHGHHILKNRLIICGYYPIVLLSHRFRISSRNPSVMGHKGYPFSQWCVISELSGYQANCNTRNDRFKFRPSINPIYKR